MVVLIGLVLLLFGFAAGRPVAVGVGIGLAALAGVELAAREHFAGYRSHNTLLAGGVGTAVFGVLFVATKLSPAICAIAGLLAFAGSAWLLVGAFRRRSGGAAYRLRS